MNFVQRFFSRIFGDDNMVFILQLLYMLNHIDWFPFIEEFLHSSDKSHMIMVYNPFNVLLDLINEYFVEALFKI